ncbi:MAG: TIGR00269 family protein [Nanoarchaeota archaeon]|nr:TIGR00269 family protein [Nanoarchaeota archaeon]
MEDLKFKRYIEKKVKKTIRQYKLFTLKDKVGVAVSGGKDSTVCLYILKKLGYDVDAITIDAGIGNYTKTNIENLKKVCKNQGIKLHIVSFKKEFGKSVVSIRSLLKKKGHNYSSCMLCGILKRYLLNKYSKKLKFDCIATGHNLDDEAQAFVMNVFRNDIKLATRQGPIAGIFKSSMFVKRVKPLYLIKEDETERYSKIMKFPVNYGICPCSVGAYRREFKNVLDDFEKKYPAVKYNVIRFHENIIKQMKKEKNVDIGVCEYCGEPASKKICKTCKIFIEMAYDGKK